MPQRSSGILSDLTSTPNTHNPWLPFGCTNHSVNFFPSIILLRSHALPHNWDHSSLFLHSLSPRTLNSNSHLGSATLYWLVLTLSLDFLGLLFWTITPLLLCLLLMVTPYYEWPLKHIHTVSCAGGHIYVYFFKLLMSPSKLMRPVQSPRWWTEKNAFWKTSV